jgi:hypothetical protein
VARVRDSVAVSARKAGHKAPSAGSPAEDVFVRALRRDPSKGCTSQKAHPTVQSQHLNGGAVLPWKANVCAHTVAAHSQLSCEVRTDILHAMWNGSTNFLQPGNVFLGEDGSVALCALDVQVALETSRRKLCVPTRAGNYPSQSDDPVVIACRAAVSDDEVHARDPRTVASLQVSSCTGWCPCSFAVPP